MGTSQTKHNTTNTNHRNIPPQTKAKTVGLPRNPKSNHHSKTRTNTHARKRSRNLPGPKIQMSTD